MRRLTHRTTFALGAALAYPAGLAVGFVAHHVNLWHNLKKKEKQAWQARSPE